MHPLEERLYELRGIAVEALVLEVHDDGQAQTIDCQTHDGIVRTGIEVRHVFGFASMPPVEGATAVLLAIGGDPGHLVALPATNPSARFGGMQVGDGGCVYAQDGSRIFVRAGGVIEIVGFTTVRIMSPDVQIEAPSGCTITGPVTIEGSLTVRDDVTMQASASIAGDLSVAGAVTGHPVTSA